MFFCENFKFNSKNCDVVKIYSTFSVVCITHIANIKIEFIVFCENCSFLQKRLYYSEKL